MSSFLSTSRVRKFRSKLKEPGNEEKFLEYKAKAKESEKKKYLRMLEDKDKLQHRKQQNAICS